MKCSKHNELYINVDRYGRMVLSERKIDRIPSMEWENVNTDVSVITDCNLRVIDGIAEETENLLKPESISMSDDCIKVIYVYDNVADGDSTCGNGGNSGIISSVGRLRVTEEMQPQQEMNVIRQVTEIQNNGEHPVRITSLSSAKVMGIGLGSEPWHRDPSRWQVHYCLNKWQGEGQWRTATLEDLGFYTTCEHLWEKDSFMLMSSSSFATSSYYPIMIIEDKKLGECWFFEIEGGTNWKISGSVYGGNQSECFHISLSVADESNGWYYLLKPGETYKTVPAVYGIVKGGFTEAVRELMRYKRANSLCQRRVPITFNDFMNCSWGLPSNENLIPLIDAAAQAGCECFCIDAGWQKDLGNWSIDESKFGECGLSGIIGYIRQKNMLPGLWTEWESCSREFADKHTQWLLTRGGGEVSVQRPLLDLRNAEVFAYLSKSVDRLYKLGIRYIKNDYNRNTGVGSDKYNEAPAEGTRRNSEKFYIFIDSLRQKYPDLYIENCGSGGMREDNGTLRHFDIQSFSDQENYLRIPSILVGSSALIAPEKLGIWAYPYPMTFNYMGQQIIPEDIRERFIDGEQTIFNMVSGFMGAMYLSGHIDNCDKKNSTLIADALSENKKWMPFIREAYPEYLCPMRRISDKTYNAYGLINENQNQMLVALWNMDAEEFSVDFKKYGFSGFRRIYPADFGNYAVNFENGTLHIKAGGKNRARLIAFDKY